MGLTWRKHAPVKEWLYQKSVHNNIKAVIMFKQLLLVASLTTVSKQQWEQQCSNLLKIVLLSMSKSSRIHKPGTDSALPCGRWTFHFWGISKLMGNGLKVGLESSKNDAKCLKPCSQAAKEHDVVTPVKHPPTSSACQSQEQEEQSCSWEPGGPARCPWGVTHQLPLLRWESRRRSQILRGVYVAVGVIDPVDFPEVLVLLLVDVLILRGLVEHGRLWLWVVFHKLHVGHHCKARRGHITALACWGSQGHPCCAPRELTQMPSTLQIQISILWASTQQTPSQATNTADNTLEPVRSPNSNLRSLIYWCLAQILT